MSGTAFITGATGQDGYYLGEHLLGLGYTVYGLIRPHSPMRGHLEQELPGLRLLEGDITDFEAVCAALDTAQPSEVYHLAAVGLGPSAFDDPVAIANVNGMGTAVLLQAVVKKAPSARVFYASSAEVYARSPHMPVAEDAPFAPRSPYGAAKAFGQHLAQVFRDSTELYVSIGILFSHESPRRSPEFVVRKLTIAAARIALGSTDRVALGNMKAQRDWGYAPDFVRAMHLSLQAPQPATYVIATGVSHSVEELADAAFSAVRLDWRDHIDVDQRFLRSAEASLLYGDPSEIRALGWEMTLSFEQMIDSLVQADSDALQRAK